MIKVETLEDDLLLMKYYYDKGWSWIYAETYEQYKNKRTKRFKEYYVWDLESLEKFYKLRASPSDDMTEFMWANGNDKYISLNDMWVFTAKEYLNTLRKKKLERIIKCKK